jgi:hypothetical protein
VGLYIHFPIRLHGVVHMDSFTFYSFMNVGEGSEWNLLRQTRDLQRTARAASAYVLAVPSVGTLRSRCRVAGHAVRDSPSS